MNGIALPRSDRQDSASPFIECRIADDGRRQGVCAFRTVW
jgi:hypothetical protein